MHYPYLNETQPRNAGARNAIINWAVIIVVFLTLRPFFMKSSVAPVSGNKSQSFDAQIKNLLEKAKNPPERVGTQQPMYSIGQIDSGPTPVVETVIPVTKAPTPTPTPVVITEYVEKIVPIVEDHELIRFRYSYYYPPLGGVNCRTFENGQCLSPMASGDPWQDWIGRAVACSSEIPLGSKIYVVAPEEVKGLWLCLDRGGGIEGTDLIDFLSDYQQLPWLDYVYAYIMEEY